MELRQYWSIVARRIWVPLGLLLLVAVFSLAFRQPVSVQFVATARMLVDVPPLSEVNNMGFDPRLTAPQATEYLVDDFSVFVTGDAVARKVSQRLEGRGIEIPSGLIQSSTSSQQLHRVVVVQVVWHDPEEAVLIVESAINTLQEEAPTYFGRLGDLQPVVRVFDGPRVSPVPPSLTERLDLPVRLLLALIAGLALCFIWHYVDPTVRDRAELEDLGVAVIAQVPGSRRTL
jgi:capsular polysaccharide biosynthesis protein